MKKISFSTSRILLLSQKNEFEKKVFKILSQEGHKVNRKIDFSAGAGVQDFLKYDLIIMDQNLSFADKTPIILMLLQQIKTADYPSVILIVSDNFSNHEFYPLVDYYITEKTEKNELIELIQNGMEAREYLKAASGYRQDLNVESLQNLFNEELTARDRELSSVTMQMMTKNNQLNQIYTSLEKINESNFHNSKGQLKSTILQFINGDDRIESFFNYFNKSQPGFIENLDKIITLTLTEKKHCACLKMGLDNKQIAALFSIDHLSVKRFHTRLKKKLGIKESQSLRDFINRV